MKDNTLTAAMELLSMDIAFGRGRDILVEVSKAVTVAQGHAGVEAKIMCRDVGQMFEAHASLDGAGAKSIGLKWSESERVYELPNGSSVRVVSEVGK